VGIEAATVQLNKRGRRQAKAKVKAKVYRHTKLFD